jgi:hypothetical protein
MSFEDRLAAHDHGPFKGWESLNFNGKSLSSDQKTWLGELANDGNFTQGELTKVYGLSRTTIQKYARFARTDKMVLPMAGNSTNYINKVQNEILKTKLGKKVGTQLNSKKLKHVKRDIKEAIKMSNKARGKASTAKKPSPRVVKKVLKQIDASVTVNAQQKTKPRVREESDLRNWLAEATMLESFSTAIPLECRINLDATQYRMTKDGILIKVAYLREDARTGPITRDEEDEDALGLGVKVYNQISASGSAAPLVFHISDDAMEVNDLKVQKVEGFGHDCNPNSFSWVVTSKTRCGNDSFYRWFILNSMLPFVADCRKAAGVEDPLVFYSMDGEELQMRNFMSDLWRPYFEQMNIYLAKHSASCSAIGNACDGGHLHMGTKQSARHLDEEDIKYAKAAMENRLDEILVTLFISRNEEERALQITNIVVDSVSSLRRANTVLKERGSPLITPTATKARRDMITDRIMRIMVAYQNVLRRNVVVHSFLKVGQVLDPDDPDEDFLERKLAVCDLSITEATMTTLRTAFPALCDHMRENGNLTEDIMDIWDVPSTNNDDRRSAPKHLRALHQQRASILNHDSVLRSYGDYQQMKLRVPVVRAEKKRRREEESAQNKIDAARRKTEAGALRQQRKKDKEEEKKRKLREKQEKKDENEAAKKQKKQKK